MKSHGIWNRISSDSYQTDKSHGARHHWADCVNVGTSAKNSHQFVSLSVSRTWIEESEKFGPHWLCVCYVDGVAVKTARYKESSRPAGWTEIETAVM